VKAIVNPAGDKYVFYFGAKFFEDVLARGIEMDGGSVEITGKLRKTIEHRIRGYESAIPDHPVIDKFFHDREERQRKKAAREAAENRDGKPQPGPKR
jgi:hypothetical protein